MTHTVLDLPPVKAYLEAVDTVINSNTMLLSAGAALGSLAIEDVAAFLCSEAFVEAMYDCDRRRELLGFHEYDLTPNEDGVFLKRIDGSFLVSEATFKVEKMPYQALVDRLVWLLAEAFCPHRGRGADHVPRPRAAIMVAQFLAALKCDQTAEVAFVEPDFLHSDRYWTWEEGDPEPPVLAYFSGPHAPTDTATFWVCHDRGFVLLTNGTP